MRSAIKIETLIIFLIVMTMGGCGTGGPAYSPPVTRASSVIDMGIMSFKPAQLTIHAGETVEWRNTSPLTHTVTDDPRQEKKIGDARLPKGAAAFDSGDIAAGQTYLYTFNAPGTYRYFCEHHESHGMVGIIVVERK
jgi:plastocyanin